MSKPQKIATVSLWIAAVVAMVGVLALKTFEPDRQAAIAKPEPLTQLYDVPAFSLIDQTGKTVTNADLKGHPWIADFIFTDCATICPTMTGRMASLQKQLPSDVKLVSFSVDPLRDTPPVMAKYLKPYNPEPGRWIFLTGDPKTELEVVTGMKLHFAPASGENPIQHDSHFVLIDADGHIVEYYDSNSLEQMPRLVHDVNVLTGHTDK